MENRRNSFLMRYPSPFYQWKSAAYCYKNDWKELEYFVITKMTILAELLRFGELVYRFEYFESGVVVLVCEKYGNIE